MYIYITEIPIDQKNITEIPNLEYSFVSGSKKLLKNGSHDKGNGRKDIEHSNGKSCCCVLHSQKI